MINETRITVVGNIGDDPELRFTPSGAAVVSFSVAVTPRRKDPNTNEWKDGEATWYRVNAWRGLAENIAETIKRGMRVIVVGNLASRAWENKDKGTSGVAWEVTAEAVGPDLTWATASVSKAARRGSDVPPPDDPWAGSAPAGARGAGYADEPPF
jgi:single-strand DNA-binding protein